MQQAIRAIKGPIHAKITVPGSKTLTYRALLLAALAEGVSEISGIRIDSGTNILIHALHQLGIAIQLDEKAESCIIAGCHGTFPKKQATLWCGGMSTIARFLTVLCSATAGVYYFDGTKNVRERSLSRLLTLLSGQGVQLIPNDAHNMPFTLVGADTLEGGEIMFDRLISSQFISALLMIAPYARSPFTLTLLEQINLSYLDMTCAMMAEFGVLVHRIHQGQLVVPVPQRYHAKDYNIEPDFSIAPYFFAATAIAGGEMTIQPLKRSQSKQTNVAILSMLEKMGCHVFETHLGLTLKSSAELQGIEVNMRDFSDAALALIAIAPFAKSPTKISHTNPLRQKEHQRLTLMKSELLKMGISIETGSHWIKIFPGIPHSGILSTHHDRHIGMALSIMGIKIPGVIMHHTECVTHFYPDFFNILNTLAEQVNISA